MNILKDTFYKIIKEPKLLIYPTLYALLNYYVMRTLAPSLEGANASVFAVNSLLLLASIMLISYLYRVAYIELVLKFFRTKKINLDIYNFLNLRISAKLVFADLLVGVIAIAGSLLFVIPGLMWLSAIMLYSVVLVENKETPVTDILKLSLKASKGKRWTIFLLIVIAGVPNLFLMSLPYIFASIIDGFISSYITISFIGLYLNANKESAKG